jgi:SAM-dependent methyltransferase
MLVHNWIEDHWNLEEYQDKKKKNFEIIDKFLDFTPHNILDIGCGLAWETRLFQKKYNSKLWLVDGDTNNNKESLTEVGWNPDPKTFAFYHKLDFLDQKLKELGTKNYQLFDANNINFPSDLKFDLILSFQSCGFHYPALTYKDLILKHSTDNTKIIFDIRRQKKKTFVNSDVEIKNILVEDKKHITAEIKFL